MPLGLKSIWGAQSRISLVQGLSSNPRKSRNLLLSHKLEAQARCWLSSSTNPRPLAGEFEHVTIPKYELARDTESRAHGHAAEKNPPRPAVTRTTATFPRGAYGRRLLKLGTKDRVPSPHADAMIKPWIQHSSKHASDRSRRKHVHSTQRQVLHEYARDALGKPVNNWRSTLDFMVRHTPKYGEVLDFKVGIGGGAAAQARASLSELDTNLWQIQQKHHCKIRIESGSHKDSPLVLTLSGSTVSVRASLLELIKVVGKVSAVRVLDPALQISLPKFWKESGQGTLPTLLLGDGESAAEDETVTVYGHTDNFVSMAQPPRAEPYQLTKRADEIQRPAVWTKFSFEQYVSKLVLARVPTHLHQALYQTGPDHQTTVVRLLTQLFTSDYLQAVLSVSALKMALRFIHMCGPMFRPSIRTIFLQAELQNLPLDAETFHTFLISASRAGDLEGFNGSLRAMHRKGHYIRAEAWVAFIAMVQDPQIKRHIIRKIRSRGIHCLQPILEEIGRQNVMMWLERGVNTDIDIGRLLHAQDMEYGSSWLDAKTLNRIIDVLGARRNLEACEKLLDLVEHGGRVRPDRYTLSTMITHTRSIPRKIALLSRFPGLSPNAIIYQQLFQAAWDQRLPNMLRVLWRYSALTGLINSHMRHALKKVMRPEMALNKKQAFLKEWEDVIFGRSELAAGRLLASNRPDAFGAIELINKYVEDAGDQQPLVGLAAKLEEAYNTDKTIHRLFERKGEIEVSPSVKESLTIDIPLGIKQRHECSTSSDAYSGVKGTTVQTSLVPS